MSTKQPASVKEQHKLSKQNKNLVRRYYREAWGNGNVVVINELFSPQHINHPPLTLGSLGSGPQAIKQLVTAFRTALPDLKLTLDDLIAEGDKVAVHFTIEGTHRNGKFFGQEPVGEPVTFTGIIVHHIANDKVVETWFSQDVLTAVQRPEPNPAVG